ncbi:AI-2E family transporter [Candidatus Nanohalococcus occultus]|uniref:PurR-regulated permease PerM n=1 Tax=Candidatus Nanohalococcus occultus TaxID=2978047 RepID=A0ABY8CEU0_9ARCH|nr:Putative PurR-regulated permease PerM [Candidatus Nanohaloarchaeota archaeon SVXNc]
MSGGGLRFKRETLGVAMLLCLGSLYILYPFLDAVVLAIATSYILRFAHNRMNNKIDNNFLSSLIIITAVLGIISAGLYTFINNFTMLLSALNSLTGSFEQLVVNFIELIDLPARFRQNTESLINTLSVYLNARLRNIFEGVPGLLIHLGIYAVTSIYLYKDGGKIEDKMMEIIENLPEEERKISTSLVESINYIFKGVFVTQFLVATILGIIAGLGFYAISMISASPIPLIPIWAGLIAITALLPLIANFMVYGPLGGYYLLTGDPVKGSLILFFGFAILQIMPEVFLRPYIGSKHMNEHPLIIFMGFLAGPLTLGLKGVVLGPLILILTKEFVRDYATLVSK